MRYQGKITNWKDDQGFGFVISNGANQDKATQKVFVHIKAFADKSIRPVDGDIISYELTTDAKHRFCAKNIRFASATKASNSQNKPSAFGIYFAVVFCIFLALSTLMGRLPIVIIYIYLAASTLTFIIYAMDKSAAKNNDQRTPENQLHMLSLLGGWLGALLAQKMLRHKSKKKTFQTVFWITVMINCLLLIWLYTSQKSLDFLNSIL